MIRETYKGRKIVVSRNKGYGARWQIKVNGVVVATGDRSETNEMAWVKGTIDAVDAAPKGQSKYAPVWYTPGTFEVNDNGHVTDVGGVCSCGYCAPVAPEPAAVNEGADTWTVTNKAGDEITRFEAARTEDAAERIRVDADCRDWFRLEGGVFRRRLYSDEL